MIIEWGFWKVWVACFTGRWHWADTYWMPTWTATTGMDQRGERR